MTMLNARLAVYLFRIQQKVQKGEYINAPMVCPECGIDAEKLQHNTDHIIFTQVEEGVKLYYVALCCEGYWGVNPEVAGLPKGNWEMYRDIKDPNQPERDPEIDAAYKRYVDDGISATDGYYAPIDYDHFAALYRKQKGKG